MLRILIVSILALPLTVCAQDDNQPRIRFFKQTYDFGQVKQEADYSYSFQFVNTGSGPLHVERVKTACKCLTPDWPDKLVKPGDTGVIKVDFYPMQLGKFFKSVQVHTNLPQQPLQLLYVKGIVIRN